MSNNDAKDPFLRILVTGGCGFLGSHLCRRLVNEGHDVIALDNFFTSQKSNVKDLLDKPNFEVIRGDVTKEFFIEVDQIYNMACPASPVHYQYNPVKTMKTSVIGAMNMLGLAKRVKARILQASERSCIWGGSSRFQTRGGAIGSRLLAVLDGASPPRCCHRRGTGL